MPLSLPPLIFFLFTYIEPKALFWHQTAPDRNPFGLVHELFLYLIEKLVYFTCALRIGSHCLECLVLCILVICNMDALYKEVRRKQEKIENLN